MELFGNDEFFIFIFITLATASSILGGIGFLGSNFIISPMVNVVFDLPGDFLLAGRPPFDFLIRSRQDEHSLVCLYHVLTVFVGKTSFNVKCPIHA